MPEIAKVGLDLAKNVFQAHGSDVSGRAVVRKKPRRDQVLAFSGSCGSALSRWQPAAAPISGVETSTSRAMRCGSSLEPMGGRS